MVVLVGLCVAADVWMTWKGTAGGGDCGDGSSLVMPSSDVEGSEGRREKREGNKEGQRGQDGKTGGLTSSIGSPLPRPVTDHSTQNQGR